MTPEERQLLTGLFDRIGTAADAPRDKEAETLIADQVRQRPYAPYLLAQTVIIQEEALKAASSRIQELENQVKAAQDQSSGGSFLGGIGKSLFGGPGEQRPTSVPRAGGPWGAPPPQAGMAPPAAPAQGPWGQQAQPGPWGGQPAAPSRFGGLGGGGFLQGAMATAAGVAGGALLYQGISSLFSGHHATSLMSDSTAGLGGAQGLTSESGLGNELFGSNSVLGGAQPASYQPSGDDAAADALSDADDDDDAAADAYDDSGDDDGDWA